MNHVVFADPDNAAARELQADALEQLGYQAESGALAQLLPDRARRSCATGSPYADPEQRVAATRCAR